MLSCKAAHSNYKIDLGDGAPSSTNDERSRKSEMSIMKQKGLSLKSGN